MKRALSAGLPLKNRRVLLGVTGSIAACKADRIIRELQDRGAEVQVLLTASGQKYFTPETAGALTGKPVLTQAYQDNNPEKIVHIEAIEKADTILVAPATANRLLELAEPTAGDLFSTILYAFEGPVFYAPAMNSKMWKNPRCQQVVEEYSENIILPDSGSLACGTSGPGRLPPPAQIAANVAAGLWPDLLADTRWVITGGPTRESWDEMRFLSNYSTGKMGEALALVGSMLGADIIYITGQQSPHYSGDFYQSVMVESCAEMLSACRAELAEDIGFIGAAAVADYRPVAEEGKIRSGRDNLQLELESNSDIISSLRKEYPENTFVGFAAEPEIDPSAALKKLDRKKLDAIVLNRLSNAASVAGRGLFVTAEAAPVDFGKRSKLELALQIWLCLLKNNLY